MVKFNRVLALVLALVLVAGLLPAGITTAHAQESIPISTAQELQNLGGQSISGTYELTDDIDMAGVSMEPIEMLTGNLNGNGHTVKNLTIASTDTSSAWGDPLGVGLISRMTGTISDICLENADVSASEKSNCAVGGLVGCVDSGTLEIRGCAVTGNVTGPEQTGSCYVGGLVGEVLYGANVLTITDSFSDATVSGGTAAGGILGCAAYMGSVNLKNCAVLGNVLDSSFTGGVVGYLFRNYTVNAQNTYFSGNLIGPDSYPFSYSTGDASNKVTLTDCAYDDSIGDGRPAICENTATVIGNMAGMSNTQLQDQMADIVKWPKEPSGGSTEEVIPDTHITVVPANATLTVYAGSDSTGPIMTPEGKPAYGGYTFKLSKGEYFCTASAYDYSTVAINFQVGADTNDVQINLTPTPGWQDEAAISIRAGQGTETSPYEIGTAAELACLSNLVNDRGEKNLYAVLTADIDLEGRPWRPIGENTTLCYSGSFDGQGHKVSGLNVSRDAGRYFGLFGCLIDATVKNVTVSGAVYDPERGDMVGGIAGAAKGNVTLQGCANLCNITAGAGSAGGLIGSYDKGVEFQTPSVRLSLESCYNAGNIAITGSDSACQIGGLTGSNKSCIQLTDCYNVGAISAEGMVTGGLLGNAGSSTGDCSPFIKNCYQAGKIIGADGSDPIYGKGVITAAAMENCYSFMPSKRNGVTQINAETLTAQMLGNEWAQDPEKNMGLPYLRNFEPERSDEILLSEVEKYRDAVAVSGKTQIGEALLLLKSERVPDSSVSLTCVQTVDDIQGGYLQCDGSTIRLKKKNMTPETVTETVTLTLTRNGQVIHKPVTVLIQPSDDFEHSLISNIAATYPENTNEWVIFDMAVYEKLFPNANEKTSADALQLYRDLLIEQILVKDSSEFDVLTQELDTRTKAEIILGTLGLDTRALTAYAGTDAAMTYDAAAKVGPLVDQLNSHYSAPWALLADQHGKTQLTPTEVQKLVKLLTDNQQENGLCCYSYYGQNYDDPDTTGAALAAFAAYYMAPEDTYGVKAEVSEFILRAVRGLSNVQQSNGSFGNVNSDAMVIVGLTALGIDPTKDARFVKDGGSLAQALNLYVNDQGNGFEAGFFTDDSAEMKKAQDLATEQGFRALVSLEAMSREDGTAYNIYTQKRSPAPIIDTEAGSGDQETEHPDPEQFPVKIFLQTDPWDEPWIQETTYTVNRGQTVYELLQTAAEENNLTFTEDGGYITSVTRGDTTYAAGAHGAMSGWMYDVNGKLPSTPMGGCVLHENDSVSIFYVRDDQTELKSLELVDAELNPEFRPSVTGYEATVRADSVIVKAEPSYSHAEVKIQGGEKLLCGLNTIKLTVTAPEETDRIYTISVTRPHEPVHHEAVPATCTKAGMKEYWSCPVCGKMFSDAECTLEIQEEELELPALGHRWEQTSYEWSDDGRNCTAFRVCTADPAHTQHVQGQVSSQITREPTQTHKGQTTYTANFPGISWAESQVLVLDDIECLEKPEPMEFKDVHGVNHWACQSVDFVTSRGLFDGVAPDRFAPESPMTRAMVMTVLARMNGVDTSGSKPWYDQGIRWAMENNISDGTFPMKNVTREQLVTMLYRYSGSTETEGTKITAFPDADAVSPFARHAMSWAVENNIIQGMGGKLAPKGQATRAQAATVLMRFCQFMEE